MITNEQIEQVVTDVRFQEIKYFQEKVNIFTIVGQTHTEHWHSAFMKWLFDPHSSLCLGHYPLARLLNLYIAKRPDGELNLKKTYDLKLNDVNFETEYTFLTPDGKKRSIDVYGTSDEIFIVIENKVKARENKNGTEIGQTKDYRDYVERKKKQGQTALYFFITPDANQKPYDTAYVQITYQELYDCVIKKCMEHPQVSKEGNYLLEQYANNLREPVNGSPMALVNIEKCHSLYEDYEEVFRQIFTDVESSADYEKDSRLTCVVYSHYQKIFDEIYLSLEDKKYGKTPKSRITRNYRSLTALYTAGILKDGMEFSMEYEGVVYHSKIVYDKGDRACYLLILDENRKPYVKDGEILGYYQYWNQAAVDAINWNYKLQGKPSRSISLNALDYWKTADGRTLGEIIDTVF